MPAKKKKQSKPAKAKQKTKETGSQKAESLARTVTLFILVLAGLLLAALGFFRLGMIGRFVFGFFALFTGWFAWIVLALIFVSLCAFLFLDHLPVSKKALALAAGILTALFLFAAVLTVDSANPFHSVGEIGSDTGSILSGTALYPIGLLNGSLAAVLVMLASKPGAILMTVLLFVIFFLLAFGPSIKKEMQKQKAFTKKELITKPSRKEIEQIFSRSKEEKQSKTKTEKESTLPARSAKADQQNAWIDLDQIEINSLKPLEDSLLFPKQETANSVKERTQAGKEKESKEFERENQSGYLLPDSSLLLDLQTSSSSINEQYAKKSGARLLEFLEQFKIPAQLERIQIGPSVTQFELHLGTGVRVNTITNLQNDIKMALAAKDIRIEAPIPGKSAIGIEIPNARNVMVSMKEMIFSLPKKHGPLTFCLGRDLSGNCIYGNLESMPHLLIAGATGSGKSVCVNSIISSILLLTRPDEVKLVLIDPKKVELTPFEEVPHLLSPVITEPALANMALKVIVAMMDQRYGLFEEEHVRNIAAYNKKATENDLPSLPHIVVIIDELADLMLLAAKEVEQSIQRITQLARAAGIHLVVATQRPSVNVLTGVIKANIPSRIAFAVSSSVDSRTILDQSGAERLLGHGDMLFLDNGESYPKRIQGVFIQDEEVNAITEFIKQHSSPRYEPAFLNLELPDEEESETITITDPLYDQVKAFVIESRKASTSLIQRKFSIGYARAARLMDALEQEGVIGPARGSRAREVYGE